MSAHPDRAAFVERYGGVFEHSPWVAEAAFDAGLPADADTAAGLCRAMVAAMRAGAPERRIALIEAHPDLAGKLAQAGELTAESTAEQASAGLDHLSGEERTRFAMLNDAYRARFGFPFVIAARGRAKAAILEAFEARLRNAREAEVEAALVEIEAIAGLRLAAMLP